MGAVWMLARRQWRVRWRGLVVMAIVVAIAGGLVLTALAGARRTRSAADRFRVATRAADQSVNIFPVSRKFAAEIGALPGVEDFAQLSLWAALLGPDDAYEFMPVGSAVDGRYGRAVDRSIIVEGRRARGPREIVASEQFARAQHLRVGSTVRFHAFTKQQAAQLREDALTDPGPQGPVLRLRVVGIDRRAPDFSPAAGGLGIAFVTNDVYREYHRDIGGFGGLVRVRLRPDASPQQFVRDVRRIAGDRYVDFDTTSADRNVDDSLKVLSIGLVIFGLIAAAATLVAVTVLFLRIGAATVNEQRVWHAVGLVTMQRAAAGWIPLAPVAILGAAGAAAVALLGSAFLPIGIGRRIEPDPGITLDPLVLGLGALAILVLVGTIAAVAAFRSARRAAWDPTLNPGSLHPSRAARVAAAAGAPPSTVVGVRMALERGRGRAAVPVRPALIGAILGIAGIVAAIVVGSSVDRVTTDPARYGWTFDTVVVGEGGQRSTGGPCGPQRSSLEREATIRSLGAVCVATVLVAGGPVNAFGYRSIRGRVDQPIVRGRAPRTANEIALGEQTLRAAGASLGDRIDVSGAHGRVRARIVGTALFPSLDDPLPLAEGVLMRPGTLSRIADDESSYNHLVVRWRTDTDVAIASRRLLATSGKRPNQPHPPLEINRLGELHGLPWLLAGFLALLAFVAVAHAVVTNARRRRAEFALLATLGFRRRQLRNTVDAQAVTLVTVGLALGIPLGLVLGRWAWEMVARDLGIAADTSVPLVALGVLVLLTLGGAWLIALLPARGVTRIRPAVALRTE